MSDYLPFNTFKGSPRRCGAGYGEEFRDLIRGFASQELIVNDRWITFGRRCWREIWKWAPISAEFLLGMSEGSGLSRDLVVLLSLEEEVYHQRCAKPGHCTALAASGGCVKGGAAVVAENWDWTPNMYPWPGLLQLSLSGRPRTLTYHYPGLWACCGVNSAGLALMWTGGGYFPIVKHKAGVPTYVLTAELLWKRSVVDCLDYLRRVPNAGCFMFLLGDARGNIALVEGLPGRICVEESGDVLNRANLYGCKEMIKASRQDKASKGGALSVRRVETVERLLKKRKGKITPGFMKEALSHPKVFVDIGIRGMTIDQLVADCGARCLWVRRGGKAEDRRWRRYGV